MKNSLTYILGATVLVGGAYLFLKNKKAKDLAKLDEIGGTTPSGTTPSGTTPSGTTSGDGVTPSDANLNLANATVLVGQRAILVAKTKEPFVRKPQIRDPFTGMLSDSGFGTWANAKNTAQKQLIELDKKLATLGYKVDAIGQLVKI